MPANRTYNLEERTVKFAEDIVLTLKKVRQGPITNRMIDQCIGAGGSVGANYCEATEAESKKDFIHKMGICKKEIKETQHWLRLLAKAEPEHTERLRDLWKEAQELLLIFSKSISTARNKH